jgi:poly(A) polymerase
MANNLVPTKTPASTKASSSKRILQLLHNFTDSRGLQAYLVGGSIRDALLNRQSNDTDILIPGVDQTMAESIATTMNGHLIPLDTKQRVFRIILPAQESNIPSDSHTLDISELPGEIEQDLRNRDFTIDAMAVKLSETDLDPAVWPVIDPTGGKKDLERHSIRAVSANIINHDPIRGLRGIRIGAELDFQITDETMGIITSGSSLIAGCSAERVRDEFLRALAQPNVGNQMGLLSRSGLLDTIIPELSIARGISQPKEHYWNVFDHSIQAVRMSELVLTQRFRDTNEAGKVIPWKPWFTNYFDQLASDGHTRRTWLRLAALLHDVGKPQTKTIEANGKIRFLGHPTIGSELTEGILRRLRVGNYGIEMLTKMVEGHLRPGQLSQKGEMPTKRAVYRFFREMDGVAIDTLYLNFADFLAARGPTLPMDEWNSHCSRITYTIEQGTGRALNEEKPTRLLDGHEVMRAFRLTPGPELRPLLDLIEEAQAIGTIETRKQALELIANQLNHPQNSSIGGSHA